MIRIFKKICLSFTALGAVMLFTSPAEAQTVGSIITNTITAADTLPLLVSVFAYITGIFLAIVSVFKFKDHVDNPAQTPLSAGMKRFFAAGMLLSLTFMAQVTQTNLLGVLGLGSSAPEVTAGNELDVSAGPAGALDTMIVNFIRDIAGPMQSLFSIFVYIAGGIILVMGIMRLTKRMDDGPRGPAGLGTIMCFIVAGALFSMSDMMGVFLNSMFGDTFILSSPTLSTDLGLEAADEARIAQVIQAVMYFIGMVGMIAFIRGWFVLRAFADGQQGATLAQGLTFLFGGTLAINMGGLINILQNTMGISGALAFN